MYSSKFLLSVAVGALLISGQAFAGFEWKTDLQVPVEQTKADMTPVDDVMMLPMEEESAPTMIENVPEPKISEPAIPTMSESPMNIVEMETEPLPSTRGVVEGFGRDVPLSYAMASIVPAHYGYAFGKDVDPALPITWKGGVPWDKVLETALHAQDLFAYITDQKISIQTVAPMKPAAIPSPKVDRQFDHGGEQHVSLPQLSPSVGREVLVSRKTGDIQLYHKENMQEDVATTEMSVMETPDYIIEDSQPASGNMVDVEEKVAMIEMLNPSTQLHSLEAPQHEEQPMIEKINPDMPRDVIPPQNAFNDNVFELVVSERQDARVLDPKKITTFHAKAGQTVRNVLEQWSDEADVQLYWETPYDFPVEKSMTLAATYPMAVQALLGGYEDHSPRPTVKLHPNWPHGPSILTVK